MCFDGTLRRAAMPASSNGIGSGQSSSSGFKSNPHGEETKGKTMFSCWASLHGILEDPTMTIVVVIVGVGIYNYAHFIITHTYVYVNCNVCMYVCMHIHMCINNLVHVCNRVCLCARLYIFLCMCICMFVCMCASTYLRGFLCACTYKVCPHPLELGLF